MSKSVVKLSQQATQSYLLPQHGMWDQNDDIGYTLLQNNSNTHKQPAHKREVLYLVTLARPLG